MPSAADLRSAIDAGITAADPAAVIERRLSLDGTTLLLDGQVLWDGDGCLYVIGAGKAAGRMATATAAICGSRITDGVVIGPEAKQAGPIRVLAGTHPTPSAQTVRATRMVRRLCAAAGPGDHVLCLLSGGASSYLSEPADPLSLSDLQATTEALLTAGLPIDRVNTIRRHCSAVKGGQLAAQCAPASVTTLAISDVVGDHPAAIGSGPTVGDPTTYADACAILDLTTAAVPPSVRAHLRAGASGDVADTPAVVTDASVHILAGGQTAVDAAAAHLQVLGWATNVGPVDLAGDPAAVARRLLDLVADPPMAVVAGGEATVQHDGTGRGGPTQEVALRVADQLGSGWVAAVDTDGADGSTDVAGALVPAGPLDATVHAALAQHDVYGPLADRGWHIHTGPTGTNVNDLYILTVS